jgi:hypothetical protein
MIRSSLSFLLEIIKKKTAITDKITISTILETMIDVTNNIVVTIAMMSNVAGSPKR